MIAIADFYGIGRDSTAEILEALLGDSFIRYVLNVDKGADLREFLTQTQPRKAHELLQITLPGLRYVNSDSPFSEFFVFFCQDAGNGLSRANDLRKKNGGDIPSCDPSDDPLRDELIHMLLRVYPCLLLPNAPEELGAFWLTASFSPVLQAHSDAFSSLLQHEEALCRALDREAIDRESISSINGFLALTNFGSSPSFQPFTAGYAMMLDAIFRASLSDVEHGEIRFETLVQKTSETVAVFRGLFSGKLCKVPALIVLSGLSLPDGETIRLNGDILRNASQFEKKHILPSRLMNATIFETTAMLKLFALGPMDVKDLENQRNPFSRLHWIDSEENLAKSHDALERKSRALRTALLLAMQDDEIATIDCGCFVSVPFSIPSSFFRVPEAAKPGASGTERAIDPKCVGQWMSLIRSSNISDLVTRRILSAFSERTDPEDAFLDLFIAIENIFGVESSNTYQISTATAVLLEKNDSEERRNIYRKMKEHYKLRSSLAHGRKIGRKSNLPESLNELKKIVIRIMKEVLLYHKDFFSNENRAMELILGTTPGRPSLPDS